MNNPKVYIIILNYNGWADTIECLESILRNDYPNYQVIIVDNNSPNNSMKYIKAWAEGKLDVWVKPDHPLRYLSFPPVKKPIPYVFYTREEAENGGDKELEKKIKQNFLEKVTMKYPLVFIQTGENLGFAGGNNVGIRYALAKNDFEYIWLLNNDTVIERTSLVSLIKSVLLDKNVGLVGSTINYYDQPQKVQYFGGGMVKWFLGKTVNNIDTKNFKIDYITGASILIPKSTLIKVGLLDETYFFYWEDVEYSQRVIKNNLKLLISKECKIYHREGSSVNLNSKNIKSLFSDCCLIKSKILFFKTHRKNFFCYFGVALTIITLIFKRCLQREFLRIWPIIKSIIKAINM